VSNAFFFEQLLMEYCIPEYLSPVFAGIGSVLEVVVAFLFATLIQYCLRLLYAKCKDKCYNLGCYTDINPQYWTCKTAEEECKYLSSLYSDGYCKHMGMFYLRSLIVKLDKILAFKFLDGHEKEVKEQD
jgi:hypothetical protein